MVHAFVLQTSLQRAEVPFLVSFFLGYSLLLRKEMRNLHSQALISKTEKWSLVKTYFIQASWSFFQLILDSFSQHKLLCFLDMQTFH